MIVSTTPLSPEPGADSPERAAAPVPALTQSQSAGGAAHSCEHCSGQGPGADPSTRALEHLGLARRRLAPRLTLGVLGVGIAVVLAVQADIAALEPIVVAACAAVSWLVSAWAGLLLSGVLARGRGARAQVALGQVLASAAAPLLALAIAWALPTAVRPTVVTGNGPALGQLLPLAVAAAAGWFFAAGVGEAFRLRALKGSVESQDEAGMMARVEAQRLTAATIGRSELIALIVALAFGACVAAAAWLPWLVLVLVPAAAAGAAWFSLRPAAAELAEGSND